MSDHGCYGGLIYEFDDRGPRLVGRCETCALRKLAAQTGRDDCTWESWSDVPELREAAQSLRDWKGATWSALLHAAPGRANFGSGKSHAVDATARQWIKNGGDAQYLVAGEFVALHRKATFHSTIPNPKHGEYRGLLVLDDLGSESRYAWPGELVDSIFDQRYRRRLPTLFTTNLDLAAFEERYPRLLSRLCEGLRLVWDAPDFRRRMTM